MEIKKPFFFDLDNMFIKEFSTDYDQGFEEASLAKINTSILTDILGIKLRYNQSRFFSIKDFSRVRAVPIEMYTYKYDLFYYNNYLLGYNFLCDLEGNLLLLFGILENSYPVIVISERLAESTNKEDRLLYKRVMNHHSIFDFLTINIKHDIKLLNFTDLQLDTVPNLDKTIKTFLSKVTQEEIYDLNEQIHSLDE
jgi:hypothetical protein